MVGPFVYLALIAVGFPAGPFLLPPRTARSCIFAGRLPAGGLIAEAPMFIDERLVEGARPGVLVSTHVTRDSGVAPP